MSNIFCIVLRSSLQRALYNEFSKSRMCHSQLKLLTASSGFCTKFDTTTTKPPSQKKTKEIPKITLLQQNQVVSVTTLEEAQKLARRRDLKLIKVQDLDPKSRRPVYRLATAAELLADDDEKSKPEKSSSSKRTVKNLTIGSRISENDLASRLKNISKWMGKDIEVRVLIQISNGDGKNSENIFKKIEATIKEPEVIGKITQKHAKDNFIKFNILPAPVVKKGTDSPPS